MRSRPRVLRTIHPSNPYPLSTDLLMYRVSQKPLYTSSFVFVSGIIRTDVRPSAFDSLGFAVSASISTLLTREKKTLNSESRCLHKAMEGLSGVPHWNSASTKVRYRGFYGAWESYSLRFFKGFKWNIMTINKSEVSAGVELKSVGSEKP